VGLQRQKGRCHAIISHENGRRLQAFVNVRRSKSKTLLLFVDEVASRSRSARQLGESDDLHVRGGEGLAGRSSAIRRIRSLKKSKEDRKGRINLR